MRAGLDRGGLSAAWGVVAVVFGGGAAATWIPAASPESKFPAWPAWILTAITVGALYLCFASLLGTWPSRSVRSNGKKPAPAPGAVSIVAQQMSGSAGGIQVGSGARVKTGDVVIVNSPSLSDQGEVVDTPKAAPG